MSWYKVRIRFLQFDPEKNRSKYVTENYIQKAETFTDIERTLQLEQEKRLTNFKTKAASELKLDEVVLHHAYTEETPGDPDEWFSCKVAFEGFKQVILISATSVSEANERLMRHLKKSRIAFTIKAVDSTPYLAVYDYENGAILGDYRARLASLPQQQVRVTKPKPNQQIPIPFPDGVSIRRTGKRDNTTVGGQINPSVYRIFRRTSSR